MEYIVMTWTWELNPVTTVSSPVFFLVYYIFIITLKYLCKIYESRFYIHIKNDSIINDSEDPLFIVWLNDSTRGVIYMVMGLLLAEGYLQRFCGGSKYQKTKKDKQAPTVYEQQLLTFFSDQRSLKDIYSLYDELVVHFKIKAEAMQLMLSQQETKKITRCMSTACLTLIIIGIYRSIIAPNIGFFNIAFLFFTTFLVIPILFNQSRFHPLPRTPYGVDYLRQYQQQLAQVPPKQRNQQQEWLYRILTGDKPVAGLEDYDASLNYP